MGGPGASLSLGGEDLRLGELGLMRLGAKTDPADRPVQDSGIGHDGPPGSWALPTKLS
jgi:hypothetical protein